MKRNIFKKKVIVSRKDDFHSLLCCYLLPCFEQLAVEDSRAQIKQLEEKISLLGKK
jgi:hypothetical protein